MEIDCYVLKARRQGLDRPYVWIKSDKIDWNTDIVRIETSGGKTVYAQCRKVDDNIVKEFSPYPKQSAILKGKDDVIVMSQYYRGKLGIEASTNKRTSLQITQPNLIIKKLGYWVVAAWHHPELYARVSIFLGIVGFILGVAGIIMGFISLLR